MPHNRARLRWFITSTSQSRFDIRIGTIEREGALSQCIDDDQVLRYGAGDNICSVYRLFRAVTSFVLLAAER